ncbi:MAG: alpha/beta hydrolase [Acidobacteriota bacterium]
MFQIDVAEGIKSVKYLLDIWKIVAASGNPIKGGDFIVGSSGATGVAHRQFDFTDQDLDELPGDKNSQLFKVLGQNDRSLQYLDNLRVGNECLVFCLHGLGLDQDDFSELLMELPVRGIAPTLCGFHRLDVGLLPLTIEAHCYLTARFIESKLAELKPSSVVLVGFSTGADLLLRLPSYLSIPAATEVACLFLDANINEQTCFISKQLADIGGESKLASVRLAQEIAGVATDLDEWINIHSYLVKVLGKFRADLAPLSQFASEILEQHRGIEVTDFLKRSSGFLAWCDEFKFVFSGGEAHAALLSDLQSFSSNSEMGLGLPDQYLTWERERSHFDLLEVEFLSSVVGDFQVMSS